MSEYENATMPDGDQITWNGVPLSNDQLVERLNANARIAAAVEAGPCTCVSLLHYRCLRCTFLAAAEQTETETN